MTLFRIALAVIWVIFSLRFIQKDLTDLRYLMDYYGKGSDKKLYWVTLILLIAYLLTNALFPSSLAGFLSNNAEINFIFVFIIVHLLHKLFLVAHYNLIQHLRVENPDEEEDNG